MTQFDIFHVFFRKFSELYYSFAFLSSTQTSQNLQFIQKMPMFEQLKKQVPVNSKFFFDPSLESYWYELFGIIKGHGQKKSTSIQPWGVIGAPLLCIFKRCSSWECSVHFFRGPWFILFNATITRLGNRIIVEKQVS